MLGDFLNLIFPRICAVCKRPLVKNEEIVCLSCNLQLPRTNFEHLHENPLKDRFAGRINIKYAVALFNFHKAGITQKLIHQLKYNGSPEIGELAGKWMAGELVKHNVHQEFDLVLPVPLHDWKKRKRGYNQSDHFARGISGTLNISLGTALLRRTKMGESQTRKSRIERWKNSHDAFDVTDPKQVKTRRVLLVDDVVTTGATIEACALTLVHYGVAEISVASIAMAK